MRTLAMIILTFSSSIYAQDSTLKPIKLQLRWDHQMQFAGYYAAQMQGYYSDAGLNVDIVGALHTDGRILQATTEVAEGRAHFGVGGADIILANEKLANLRVVATFFQESAARIYIRSEDNFTGLKDLAARFRFARQVDSLIDVELQAMLKLHDIDPESIKTYAHEQALNHLINQKVDVIPGYATTAPIHAQLIGVKIQEIRPSSFGVNFSGDSLMASDGLIEEDPELVHAFTKASKRGWEFALQYPDRVQSYLENNYERVSNKKLWSEINQYQTSVIKGLMHHPFVPVGTINSGRWKNMHNTLRSLDIIHSDFNKKNIIWDAEDFSNWEKTKAQQGYALFAIAITILISALLIFVRILYKRMASERQSLNSITKFSQHQEMLFTSLFTATPDAIVMTNNERSILLVNPAFKELFGYDDDELLGNETSIFYNNIDDFQKMGESHFNETSNQTRSPATIFYKTRNGRVFPGETLGSKYFSEDGKAIGYFGIIRDITDRNQAEENLRKSQKLETVGMLASGIAHDFNNIIGATLGYAEMGLISDDVVKHRSYFQSIKEASNSAASLTRQLLSFSRGKLSVHDSQSVIIGPVVKDTFKFLRSIVPTSVVMNLHIEEIDKSVKIDPIGAQQLLMNLGINASNAIGEVSGQIDISVSEIDISNSIEVTTGSLSAGSYVLFEITDTGGGIDSANEPHVFEVFYTTRGHAGGTGLGLYICRRVVLGAGGQIDIHNTPGEGVSIRCYLPVSDEYSSGLTPKLKEPSHGQGQSVAVMDDDDDMRTVLVEMLSALDYQVIEFNSPLKGLNAILEDPSAFSLLITDQVMPELTGVEVAKRLRKSDIQIPIILCSGMSQLVNHTNFSEFGISQYLEKPISLETLSVEVQQLLAT